MAKTSAKAAIGFSNIAHAYTHLFMLLYPTVVLALEREFSRPYGELLSLSLLGFILLGAGALPAGWLGDRWSTRGMMAVFFLGIGASGVFTGLAETPFQIAAGLGLIGLFGSIYHPVGIALLVAHARSRGTSLGINGVFGNAGTATAALVAGALTDLISWRAAFIVPGVVAMATGVAFLLLVKEAGSAVEQASKGDGSPPVSRRLLIQVTAILSVTLLCNGLIYQVTAVSMPKVFAERITDFTASGTLGIGGLVSAVYLASSFAQLAGGYLADRVSLKAVFVLAYLFQVPLFVFASIATGHPLLVAAVMLVSLNVGAAPAETSLIARYSPARWRATAFGAKFAIALGVSALGVPMVAMIYDGTGGFFWLYVILAALAAITVVAAMFLPSERRMEAAGTEIGSTETAGRASPAVPAPSQGA